VSLLDLEGGGDHGGSTEQGRVGEGSEPPEIKRAGGPRPDL